jgi:nucleoside-diphosphate-sugar epimerase
MLKMKEERVTASDQIEVVFGTGAIGMALIEELHASGKKVRAVNRAGHADVPDGVEVVGGDATDEEFTKTACGDASVVYFCLNPPYTSWPELFPPLQAGVLAGAASAGAKLVAIENLYAYGPTGGQPLTEEHPYAATTRKGRVRAQMTKDLMAAHEAGRVRVAIGRASDYYGARGALSVMGGFVFYPALDGKTTRLLGKPDMPHTYSYLPDIARGLAILGERDEALGHAWHLPNAETLTSRRFVEMIYETAGNRPQISATPKIVVRLLGLRDPIVGEMVEMLYEFEEPFVVDDSRFKTTFGNHATPLSEAIDTTVAWYRANPEQAG